MDELSMLSPYISFAYLLSVFYNYNTLITLLTPITWVTCIVGFTIILYKRFIQKRTLSSYIFKQITDIHSDIPLIIFKLFIIYILIQQQKPITRNGLFVTTFIIGVYLSSFDIANVYELNILDKI